jgi:hypothetical protein
LAGEYPVVIACRAMNGVTFWQCALLISWNYCSHFGPSKDFIIDESVPFGSGDGHYRGHAPWR